MMETLNTYGRPFYQRGTEMVVPSLCPGTRPTDNPSSVAGTVPTTSPIASLSVWPDDDPACAAVRAETSLAREASPFSSAVTEPPSPNVEPGSYALLQFPYHIARHRGYAQLGLQGKD